MIEAIAVAAVVVSAEKRNLIAITEHLRNIIKEDHGIET